MITQIVIYHKIIEEIIRVQRELDFVWTVLFVQYQFGDIDLRSPIRIFPRRLLINKNKGGSFYARI